MVQVRKREPRQPAACCADLGQLLSPRLFKALADPSRTALLVRLAEGGVPRTVSEAARGGSLDLSVVSRHLAVLRDAGVVQCTRRGKEVLCTVRADVLAGALRHLADALEACCPGGEEPAQERGRTKEERRASRERRRR